ncbi:Hypothetical protein, putative [Bodo saltans]|uniref:Uncharacterized protein n=1 Tax=Bodo saltans TaxID=75058 RepID=A0A0S4J386_BODSA|nr:Hypothetical protein, putative [Bodo saltans]|eukprot:CUG85776.1 Hypothetical protein, putative [Bodo saltans]
MAAIEPTKDDSAIVIRMLAERTNISLLPCVMSGKANSAVFAVRIGDTKIDLQSYITIAGLRQMRLWYRTRDEIHSLASALATDMNRDAFKALEALILEITEARIRTPAGVIDAVK